MADIDWPAVLPPYSDIMLDGFADDPPDLAVRSPTDAGYIKARRRFTDGPEPVNWPIPLTQTGNPATDQVDLLRTFFLTTTKSGTLRFNWTHPRTLADVVCIFTGAPQFKYLGTFAVAVLPLLILPNEDG